MYVNLHSHTFYSILDGYSSPDDLCARAAEIGMPGIAITDHGTLAGARDFQKAADKHGIKPVIGCEMYISPTDRFDRRPVKQREDNTQLYNHLIVLGKNQQGYETLSNLSTTAWKEGLYYKPRIDKELLAENNEGLIVLSGCMNGLIAKAIAKEDMELAEEHTRWFKGLFGDDFYMEIQSHNPPEINAGLMAMARKFDVKPVATLDCHFTTAEDRVAEELLLILSTSPKVGKDVDFAKSTKMDIWDRLNYLYPERVISFEKLDLYLQDVRELNESLSEAGLEPEELIDNTLGILEKIGDYERYEGVNLLPVVSDDPYETLRKACLSSERITPELTERLYNEELPVIKEKDFASYFLIVADLVAFAKASGIMVGPGRGSAAGSAICYLLGITDVDPVKHKLLFGRFINRERNDYPDIDIDFQDDRRWEVKEYAARKYKNIASVSTFSMFTGSGTVRDVARTFRIPLGEVEQALANVDTLEDFYYSTDPATRDFKLKYPEIEVYCRKLQGRIRSVGMHAAGIVVSSEPIDKYAPVEYRKSKDSVNKEYLPVIALDKKSVEALGLLKIDLLGLKALSVLSTALESIKDRHFKEIKLLDIPFDDADVYKMLSDGYTRGVFQAEAGPYTNALKSMVVENFDELSASTALVRPGAMNTIGEEYIERKHGRRPTIYANETYRKITEETFGVIVYQEQVMQAMNEIAGMSWATADKVRKIIGSKGDVEQFEEYREAWMDGAVNNGKLDPAYAEKLWHDFEAHAGYSFNKSHSVAYSYLTYWSAWLKFHYPTEFMAAVLQHEGDKKALTTYLLEARRLGIKMMLPDINRSEKSFALDGNGIRFGLTNIKFIADAAASAIIAGRPFRSYQQFYEYASAKNSGLSSRIIGAVNKVNAAPFGDNPRRDVRANMYEYLGVPYFDDSWMTEESRARMTPCGHLDPEGSAIIYGIVNDITTKPGANWTRIEVVDDSGVATFFAGKNPPVEEGGMYAMITGKKSILDAVLLNEIQETDKVWAKYLMAKKISLAETAHLVLEFKGRRTKAGKNMATVIMVNSKMELISLLVFPQQYAAGLKHMKPGSLVEIQVGYTKDGTSFVDRVRGME